MERPERPSRHKSNPVKFPIRPSFSSDSDSELNESEVTPIQITYYKVPEGTNANGGASTSSAAQQPSQSNVETSTNITRTSPVPRRATLSPLVRAAEELDSIQPIEPPAPPPSMPQDPLHRKRSAAAMASVIFDSVDSLIASNSSSRTAESPPERPMDRFQHTDFVIRPRSFCNIDCMRPPVYKFKRPNGPIDLTPSSSNRDSSIAAPVVSSGFTLRDPTLPSTSDSPSPSFYNRSTGPSRPYVLPQRSDNQPSSSSILRQFDEMCSSSPVIRRRGRAYLRPIRLARTSFTHTSNQLIDGNRFGENSQSETANNNPLISRNSSVTDDYCDLVGSFLFNYPNSEPLRSPEGVEAAEAQSSNTTDVINRHIATSTPDISNEASILNAFLNQPSRTDGEQPMEQGNDDVIVVETPERPPLPGSPDIMPYMVPSSRSPSPIPSTTPPRPKKSKAQSCRDGDVPMTLQELNQTLVSLLECPVCLDHATPPIYQCSKGHILCQSCHPRLTTCPICRSRLPGDRNSAMEKVAEKLMYPCKNTVTGCGMMLKLDDKQEHEEGCGFRHYACIVHSCHWKGYKPELVVHLQSDHPDKLISGANKEVHVSLAVPVGGSMFNAHHWIQSAHNEVFNVIFHVDLYKRLMKGCVIYIGSPEKADKFKYVFELKQRVPPFRTMSYSRTTHADTLKPGQPLCLSNDFNINIEMARLYRPSDCAVHTIPVHVSILQQE